MKESLEQEAKSYITEKPDENICKFSDSEQRVENDLSVSRFIYETSAEKLGEIIYPAFGCHLVTGGSAVIAFENGEQELTVGDMFFSFPMIPFSLKENNGLKYLYINFVGGGVGELLMSMGINRSANIRHGMDALSDIWFFALGRCNSGNLSMLGRGLLYYTFAMIPGDVAQEPKSKEEDVVQRVKRSAEMCYQNEDLSIDYLAKQYKYNSKYLSRKFTAAFGVTFTDYLESCRMNHACVMLTETDKAIGDIALSVGYHDPLYFSKVFKKNMKQSPTEYRRSRMK